MFSLLQHSLWFIILGLLPSVLVCPLHAGIDPSADATSEPAGQAGIVAQKNGLASHHLSPAASDHEGERDDDPPPAKRTQSDPAAPIACSRCQKTLNEQALTRVLPRSTAESVACDACLYPASQTLPKETTGKRKATRKRTRPAPAAPQAKRSKSQAGKRKQAGNPQGEPAAKRARLETQESTTGTVEGLDILKQHLAFEMDEQETEAAKQLFERLKNKKLKVKKSLWKLLSKVDRKGFPAFCTKASVFFSHLTTTITDTGCLTSMLKNKKHLQDFANREHPELEYLARLDTLRTFSSMNNGRGFPKQADVDGVKRWKVWEVDGKFSMELFRAFSSMNHGKGLPKQADVKDVTSWKVWEVDGEFSMELLRAFSSMNNGKGLPKQADVEEVKRWKVLEVDGKFSMELFRAFSSMNHGKGLPKQADVKDVTSWKVWEVDGKFSLELLRAFSSMNCKRGLPKQADVEDVKSWKVWEVDGKFSLELLRAFSSMNSGKGLPKQADVEDVKRWKVWEVDGKFNMELLRAFSSMNHGKGLPKQADVEDVKRWKVWEVDGRFSMELLRAFSSMNHAKGLPKQADVEDLKRWKVWEVDGQFSMELLRAFSSMNNGKGLLKQADVGDVMRWKVWEVDGQFSMALFRAFSSMNSGKGLPKQADVEAVLAWLNCGGTLNDVLQSLMVRLYASAGTPDTKKLKQYEQKLSALFFANASTEPESDDEEEQSCLIKQVALFLLTRKPQYFLNLGDVEYFYQQVTGDANRRLGKLLRLLTSYGRAGVTRYRALNNNDRSALLSTCTSRIPLPLAMKAINEFSPHERKRYLFFSRNLKAPLGRTQWNDILRQLKRLTSVLKNPHTQRLYLEVVWSLPPSDRDVFLDETRVATVTAVFPSLNALKNLANRHSSQWLKELLEACLQYRQGTPSKENIKRLFTALLETQLPLYDHNDIPDYFLSGYMALGDSALFIRVTPPIQTAEELALHFVAAVTGVLSDMYYHYAANQLKVQQYGGEVHTFPVPELEIHDDGIKISHWSAEVFSRFLAITEFPEHYYFSQEAWQQHCTPGLPGYFQRRMAACHQRESAAPDAITFHPLSIPALMGLLKHNIRINPCAWKSFDHHKDRLPGAAHSRLLSEIKRTDHEDIPVSLKGYLEARRPPEEEALPQNEMNAPASPPPAIAMELLSEEEQFQRLWADLSGKTLVVVADLELLAGYKDYMTMEHIVSILKRADVGMEPYRFDELRRLLGEKKDRYLRHDPLLLNLPDEVANYLIEADI